MGRDDEHLVRCGERRSRQRDAEHEKAGHDHPAENHQRPGATGKTAGTRTGIVR